MTVLVRNEVDVIRQWLDYHLANGVDEILVTDHRSTDGTTEVLREYERRGNVQYAYESCAEYEQSAWVTAMARRAFLEHDADWVINGDADEFYVTDRGTLKTVLNALPANTDVVTIRRNDMPPVADSSGGDPLREMIYRKRVSRAWPLAHVILDKVIHRGFPDVQVRSGAHRVDSSYFRVASPCQDIETLHFPIRSWRQFHDKVRCVGEAHMANVGPDSRYHRWCEAMKTGELADMYQKILLRPEAIPGLIAAGEIIEDSRLATFLSEVAAD